MNTSNYNESIMQIIASVNELPEIEPPSGFRERVMQAVRAEAQSPVKKAADKRTAVKPRVKRSYIFFGATAACVVLAVFALLDFGGSKRYGSTSGGGSSYTADMAVSQAAPAAAPMPAPTAPMPAPAAMVPQEAFADGELEMINGAYDAVEAAVEEEIATEMTAVAQAAAEIERNAETGIDTGVSAGDSTNGATTQKIIKNAYYNLQVTEYDVTVSKIQQLAESSGGFIESLSTNVYQTYLDTDGWRDLKNGYICLRVPQNEYAQTKIKLENLGKITNTSESVENITGTYVDTAARLEVKKAEEQRLLELYARADKIEDLIALEARLTVVRSDIEGMLSQLQNWDRSVSFSTINISIEEVADYSQIQPVDPTLGEKITEGFYRSVAAFTRGMERLIVGIAENSIALLIILAIAFIVFSGFAIIRRKRRADDDEI